MYDKGLIFLDKFFTGSPFLFFSSMWREKAEKWIVQEIQLKRTRLLKFFASGYKKRRKSHYFYGQVYNKSIKILRRCATVNIYNGMNQIYMCA